MCCRVISVLTRLAAIYYNLVTSSLDAARNKHDEFNSMAAGALAGGIYKCTGKLAHGGVNKSRRLCSILQPYPLDPLQIELC
jgi:hypothetical protein